MKILLTKTENLRSDQQKTSAGKSGSQFAQSAYAYADCATAITVHSVLLTEQICFTN